MPYTHSTADDYLYWDNTESVTLTTTRSSVESSESISIARRNSVGKQEAEFNGLLINSDSCVWCLPFALVSGNEPTIGSQITDSSSTEWQVLSVNEQRLGSSVSHYHCVCRKEQ